MADGFDVWFVKADTVYKAVPYGVVSGWAEQGRLGADDKVKPAGVTTAWVRAADHPLIGDFLAEPGPPATTDPTAPPTAANEPAEPVELGDAWHRKPDDEDDEVDMIPLIDISLVLLIFFMMTSAVATVSPIDVPGMKNAAELSKEADSFTLDIDKRATGETIYAVRVGAAAAEPDDSNLLTLDAAVTRLKVRLGAVSRPPEVRIACNQELTRQHVHDAARELDKLKTAGMIAFYGAEVNEVQP